MEIGTQIKKYRSNMGISQEDLAEKVKKENHISTYKEIVAFTEGKRLDEIEEQQERGKRPYQSVLLMLGSAATAFAVVYLMAKLFSL